MFEELFTSGALTALFQVIMIDLVLGGDNAIIIGLAAAGLPAAQRGKVILIGIAAAYEEELVSAARGFQPDPAAEGMSELDAFLAHAVLESGEGQAGEEAISTLNIQNTSAVARSWNIEIRNSDGSTGTPAISADAVAQISVIMMRMPTRLAGARRSLKVGFPPLADNESDRFLA